jgi:glycosyltransferase involved in cell wall biosynthesis
MSSNPLVSVVVTAYWSAQTLELCLSSIRSQTYPNIEIIVVDTASNDGTQVIGKKYADKFFQDVGPERSAKRNFGVRMSTGHFVFIVDSDMELEPDVVEQCVKVVVDNPTVKAVVVPEKSTGVGFWTHCKALERSFYVGVDWMEAARFFNREIFLSAGGYDEKNTGSEDYDLPQRIKKNLGKIAFNRINAYATQHEGRISLLVLCRKKFYYAQSFVKYSKNPANSKAFQMQSGLLRRYLLYFSSSKKLFERPSLGVGLLFLKSCEFLAGGLGYFYYLFVHRVFITEKK